MSAIDTAASTRQWARAQSYVIPVFSAALFLSAFLLFAVQPLFAKMVLPKLGGSPAVWSVAMVFFQAILLLGYAYAHLLTSKLQPRVAALTHISLMAVVLFAALPISLSTAFGNPPAEGHAFWLIGVFAVSVGLPFFTVSANGPLLQAWFSKTGHKHASDPYFLYGASNIGSFLALLSYPFLIEPISTLSQQSHAWMWGFAVLIACIAACGGFVAGASSESCVASQEEEASSRSEAPNWKQRAGWTGFAFVPSALLVAVTAHISTDVAAAPFLWVVPLSLFLLTFIITFQRKPIIGHDLMLRLQPIFIALPAISILGGINFNWGITLALHLGAFFVNAMVCHGELVKRRPQASQLTEFYLWMSLGGVLGGLFAGLLAPHIFSTVLEYPLIILAALMCRPGLWDKNARTSHWKEAGLIAAIGFILILPNLAFGQSITPETAFAFQMGLILFAALIMLQGAKPGRLIGMTAAALMITSVYHPDVQPTESHRSFFGVHKIVDTHDGRYRLLMHGTTIHGGEMMRNADGSPVTGRPQSITYFGPRTSYYEAINAFRDKRGGFENVAVVGLGAGVLSCYRKGQENWRFYEIDPEVVKIAKDPSKFRYLSECSPQAEVVLGDARLTLQDAKPKSYDLIVLDAFTSNAIPIHLMTKEAVATYLHALKDDGVIIMHISNRSMSLAHVVGALAKEYGLVAWKSTPRKFSDTPSLVEADPLLTVLAHKDADLGRLTVSDRWDRIPNEPDLKVWSDDYANLLGAIWRKVMQ